VIDLVLQSFIDVHFCSIVITAVFENQVTRKGSMQRIF